MPRSVDLLDAGGEVVEVELPSSFMALLDAGRAILEAEAAAVHEAWFRDHADEYGPQIAGLVRAGLALDPAAVARAREVRTAFRSAIAPLLEGVDALLSPVAPGPAPLRSEGHRRLHAVRPVELRRRALDRDPDRP